VVRAAQVLRIERLIEVATRIFIEHGYRRARMEDVAEALGVAKGTLYLYVENKDALFDLVVRSADREVGARELPMRGGGHRGTIDHITKRLAEGQVLRELATALTGPRRAPRVEVEAIAGEIFDRLYQNRNAIRLVDRVAREIPELGAAWFGGSRKMLIMALARYIARGVEAGELRTAADPEIAARTMVEICGFWAVHRHWDMDRQIVDEDRVRASVIEMICAALGPVEVPS
jgi:AcrR family transcriptional regulator